jgi:hypothetical protein
MARTKRYKMVRIPEEEYEELIKARRELRRKGLDSLPDDFPDEEADDEDGDFTMGLLVGLGAAALLYLLTRNKTGEGVKN